MREIAIAFGIALLASLVATPLVRTLAVRLDLVDRPDGYRKLHGHIVPLMGGVAVYVAFGVSVAAICLLRLRGGEALPGTASAVLSLLAAAAIVLVVGLVDDAWDLRPRWKLLAQAAAAAVAMAGGYVVHSLSVPFLGTVDLGLLALPLSLFWFLGCVNSVNLLDGMDGLAAGVGLTVSLTLLASSLLLGHALAALLAACLSGVLAGFLVFNFHPARIFLGDAGSTQLGFVLGALSLVAARKEGGTVLLFVPVMALALPLLDTALAIVRRWSRKLPFSAGDREHLHHLLLARGLGQRRAATLLCGVCAACGTGALLISTQQTAPALLGLVILAAAAYTLLGVVGLPIARELRSRIPARIRGHRRCAAARVAVHRALSQIERANSPADLWRHCGAALEALGLSDARLELSPAWQEGTSALVWGNPAVADQAHSRGTWKARFDLRISGATVGRLSVRQFIHEGPVLSEAPELVDELGRGLARRLEMLRSAAPEPLARRAVEELEAASASFSAGAAK